MERRVKSSNQVIIFVFFILFLVWILLQFIAPFALPNSSIKDLSGVTGVSDNEDVIDDMSFPWNSVYRCGDRLCHQKAERSFFLNGNQMPFCSRCTAIWIGLTIGLFLMFIFKIALNEKFLILLIIAVIPVGIDGLGQLFGLWESTNIIRVITGLLIGFVCGMGIGFIIDESADLIKERLIKKRKRN